MRKVLALAAALVLLVGMVWVPVAGESLVKVLMSTPGVTCREALREKCPTADELDDAVECSRGVIPEDVLFTPGRLTLMATGHVTCDEEVYDVSFKVWSTINRAIGLFFLADDADTWELLTCNLGDVIEGRFQAPGTYAIAVGW